MTWVLCWIRSGGEWRLLLVVGARVFRLKARMAEYPGSDPT